MADLVRLLFAPIFWTLGFFVYLVYEARILRIRIGQVLFVVFAVFGLLAWRGWRSSPPKLQSNESSVALSAGIATATDNLLGQLPRPKIAFVPTLVLPFRGDRDAIVETHLTDRLREQSWYLPVEAGMLASLRIGFEKWWDGSLSSPDSIAAAEKMAQAVGAEAVVFGSVERLEMDGNKSHIELRVTVAREGSILFDGIVGNVSPASAILPAGRRVAWLVAVAGVAISATLLLARRLLY